jgi:Glycoside hydrolase 123, catalytic domain
VPQERVALGSRWWRRKPTNEWEQPGTPVSGRPVRVASGRTGRVRLRWVGAGIAVCCLGLVVVGWPPTRRVLAAARAAAMSAIRAPRLDAAPQALPRERPTTPEGLSFWVVDDSTKILPGEIPREAPRAGSEARVSLDGAAGETVAFQLILASLTGSPRVEADVSSLDGPVGRVPRESVNVFLESYLSCPPVAAKVVALGPGEYPDALIPLWEHGPGTRAVASPFALAPKRNQGLWIDVEIPRGARAGDYHGWVRVKAEGLPEATLGVDLRVYGFELPAQRHLPAWVPLYATRLWKGEQLDHLEERQVNATLWDYFRMAHAHGFMTQVKEDEPDIEWDKATGALVTADWRRYDALNGPVLDGSLFADREPPSLWKVGGGHWWGARPGDPPNFGGDHNADTDLTPAHRRALREYAAEIERHFRERRWAQPTLFTYWVDEPDFEEHPNYAPLIKAFGDVLNATGTRIKPLLTAGPEEKPELHGAVGIWATPAGDYIPSEMRRRQQAGDRTWFYQQHEPFVGGQSVDDEGLAMRTWPWIAWRYGVDGIFLWAGNFWNEDPYHDPKNWNRNLLGNGILFYPGRLLPTLGFPAIRGPVSSIRMKSLRRGLQDFEYFYLLRSLGGNADPAVARVVRSALNEKGWRPSWTHPRWQKPGDWSHDPADWDSARRAVAAEILQRLGSRPSPEAAPQSPR